MNRPFVIAITGRSGCGKSTVSDYYRSLGYPVLDADREARRVTEPGSPVLEHLCREFGEDLLAQDGSLCRRLLAQRAFATQEGTRKLTDITHPAIVDALKSGVEAARKNGAALCFVDGAAIVGEAFEPSCDRIVVVTAPRETSAERIMRRDGLSREDAYRRLDAQLPEADLRAAAHYLIENDSDLPHLLGQAQRVLADLLAEGDA